MKKNGFTVVELLMAFVITATTTIILFSLVINLQKLSDKSYKTTEMRIVSTNFTKLIEDDLYRDSLAIITNCGTNCYDFTYKTLGTKRLSIDTENRVFKYGNYQKQLQDTTYFEGNISIVNSVIDNIDSPKYDAILTIKIPITSDYYDGDFGVVVVYQYDSALTTVTVS